MPIHPLNDEELRQATEVSWNPAVRRLLDWYRGTLNAPQHADAPAGAVAAPVNPAAFAGAPAPAPAAPVVELPLISLGELRKLAAYTVPQAAGLLRCAEERVQDIESLDLELLDVDQLTQYTTAIGMPITIQIDLMPGATREIYTTRGKVEQLQKLLGSPGGQHQSQTNGLAGAAPAVVDGDRVPDTMPPGPGELHPEIKPPHVEPEQIGAESPRPG